MTLAVVLVIAAFLSLVVVLRTGVLRTLQLSKGGGRASQIEPLDVEAFRNLADPAEDAYLHLRLGASEFRKVRRARLHAMAAYVQTAGRNAAVLVVIGQAALASGDARTAEAALNLINQALLLRRNAAFVLIRIYAELAWPRSLNAADPFLDAYQQLSGAAMLLGRLQNPAVPVRIAAQ